MKIARPPCILEGVVAAPGEHSGVGEAFEKAGHADRRAVGQVVDAERCVRLLLMAHIVEQAHGAVRLRRV